MQRHLEKFSAVTIRMMIVVLALVLMSSLGGNAQAQNAAFDEARENTQIDDDVDQLNPGVSPPGILKSILGIEPEPVQSPEYILPVDPQQNE